MCRLQAVSFSMWNSDQKEADLQKYRKFHLQNRLDRRGFFLYLYHNAIDRFVSGIGDFFYIFGNLDIRNKFPVFILDGGKFVNPSE